VSAIRVLVALAAAPQGAPPWRPLGLSSQQRVSIDRDGPRQEDNLLLHLGQGANHMYLSFPHSYGHMT
jgi:hypothetical protein